MLSINPYISDILSQPAALRKALENYPAAQIEQVRDQLQQGKFSRIVLTGMGSSYNAAYPAWLKMLPGSTPIIHVNTAELLHYGQEMIDAKTLLWINSQSGRSIEIVRLLDNLKDRRPAFQLSMSNYLESPMAQRADLAVPIHAGDEATVSSKTFINMLTMLYLSSIQLTGGDWQTALDSMLQAADAMEAYLAEWQDKVNELDTKLGEVDQLLIVGRGASMGAVWNGALISKEASKCTFEGMNVADFRHGPLELASSRLTLLMLEGAPQTSRINRELAREVIGFGGNVLWLSTKPDPDLPGLLLPEVDEIARPLVEILPMQMLTLVMSQRHGIEPGKFRNIGKVTLDE
jgi:glucosamine--fructose-6-phosphate aminotransferase (isomerizing)